MAEIKSTLDLIMERTKDLTLTDEEKKFIQRKEWEGKVKGWVQKFMDDLIDIHHLKSDLRTQSSEYPEIRQLLKMELLENIQPDRDNGRIFQLFEEVLNFPSKSLKNMIKSFSKDVKIEAMKRMDSRREELRDKKIYGSSVIPNLHSDDRFLKFIEQRKTGFKQQVMTVSSS